MTDRWTEMRDELSALTVSQLKEIAREEFISLGYQSSRKREIVNAIVTNRRYRETEGITLVDMDGEVVA